MEKLALIYDFDKTLSPKNMQEFHYISSLGFKDSKDFWAECSKEVKRCNMDSVLAYMMLMLKYNNPLTKSKLIDEGKYIKLYKGVDTWFKRINAYGRKKGIEVEHYIISSGIKEMIEGTKISKEFKKIYACSYSYDLNEEVKWPAMVVNYTTKTQYLFRINKGVLDETNDFDLNRSTPEEEKYIPFSNMVYFGDGLTDVPSMKVVKNNGGYTVAVYDSISQKETLAQELKKDKRATFAFKADYSKDSKIEQAIKGIIDSIAINNKLDVFKIDED